MKILTPLTFLATTVFAKNILMSNDDGWASTNIRAFYYKLKEAGHNVYITSPVSQRSGYGGKFDIPESNVLEIDGEFSYPPAGSPAWGHEEFDDHIWYFNGTPASCIAFAFDYLLPKYFDNVTIDLVVAGTMGATYNAVYRGYPAISFSASNWNNSFYKDNLDLNDPLLESTIVATKAVELVNQVFESQGENPRALGLGVGLNVNFPAVGYDDETCMDPKWTFTRITGEAAAGADLQYDEKTNTFGWGDDQTWAPLTACYNGDCTLPSETYIIKYGKCQATISTFSIDFDANAALTSQVKDILNPLF
ncbi:PHO2 Acid phosphatase [Candida maltosa Xu316]